MSPETLNAIEHIIVALAALGGAYFAYRKANDHTNGRTSELEERLEELERELEEWEEEE